MSGPDAPTAGALETSRPKYDSILSMYKRLFFHVNGQWKGMVAALLCMIAISVLEFAIPQLTRVTLDSIIPERRAFDLVWVVAGVLGAALLLGMFSYGSSCFLAKVGQQAVYSLRNDLYRHLQRLDLVFFDRNRTGDLMSRVTNDVNMLQQVVSAGMIQIATDLFTFTAIMLYMFYTDWKLTLVMLAAFPVMGWTTQYFRERMRSSYRNVQQSVAEVSNHLQDTLSGIRLIKTFSSEEYELARFSERNGENMQANMGAVRLRAIYEPLIDWLNHLGMVAVLAFGAWQAIRGNLSVGEIVAFLSYQRLLQNPIRRFSRLINTMQQAGAAYERIMEVMGEQPRVTEKPDAVVLPPMKGHITFRNVDFFYEPSVPVLRQLNLDIAPGKITALVGSSGAGKSTIAHLIARFYDVCQGEITVDGYPLTDVKLSSLRMQMGVVSQDIVLLNGTIRDNIAYGKPDATDEEVEAAARAAYAHEFISAFPNGYGSWIGERGVKLSGGQKQRISMARALLLNPALVILDEATSALDTESENLIQQALSSLLSGRTCLVIAHRLSTIRRADCIYVLEQGRVLEAGTHDALYEAGGKYRQLHDMQFPQEEPVG